MALLDIKFNCNNCGTINNELLDQYEIRAIKCKNCGYVPFEAVEYSGYVYVLSNASFPDKVKIGCTERLRERIKELNSSTSIFTPFVLEAIFISKDHTADEAKIHVALSNYRVNPGKEFFKLSLEMATQEIANIIDDTPAYLNEKYIYLYKKISDSLNRKQKEEGGIANKVHQWFIEDNKQEQRDYIKNIIDKK